MPKKQEKEVISIRISTNLLATVDQKSASFDISRNEFITITVRASDGHYIFSGAEQPMSSMPFFRTLRAVSASRSRAFSRPSASPLMRQAL